MWALFIILVGLMMTRVSEKMLISTRCIHGFMSNLIKKSLTDSILDPPTACYLVSRVDVGQELHSTCDRFTSFVKKPVNVNYFILENNLELVMFRVWNYYAMQMSTNIFILQMFFMYLWFNLKTICQYVSKV